MNQPHQNVPTYQIVPAAWPLGYHPVTVAPGAPFLACDRCGSLVWDTGQHDAWHAALGR